jgi:hypothetical protein
VSPQGSAATGKCSLPPLLVADEVWFLVEAGSDLSIGEALILRHVGVVRREELMLTVQQRTVSRIRVGQKGRLQGLQVNAIRRGQTRMGIGIDEG